MGQLSLDNGRIEQKLKTRERLIAMANTLLLQGQDISVEVVAKEAGISKATAYRYFTGTDGLKREASLQLKAKTSDDLFAGISETDLKARINRLIDYHFDLFTKMKRSSACSSVPLSGNRLILKAAIPEQDGVLH